MRTSGIHLAEWIFALLLAAGSIPSESLAQKPILEPSAICRDLAKENFSGIADAPTRIGSTEVVVATETEPAYCKVTGTIEPRVGFEMRLPLENWSGRFLEVGCGIWCGVIFSRNCNAPLRRGYACIASDMGHKGSNLLDLDWWKDNLQGQIDFGYRATHVAALAGKAIAAQFYGKRTSRSYFLGCSTGGYQGVTQAQRFPWDFDGIVAGAPDIDETQANFNALWFNRVTHDVAGSPIFGDHDLTLLHNAALAACDLDDGVKDGIIGNPRGCRFHPRILRCKSGQTSSCLTASQVDAAQKIYSGPTNGAGESTSKGSVLIGSELGWGKLGSGTVYFRQGGLAGFTTPPNYRDADFDFDSDHKRLGLAAWYQSDNPDLRKLKGSGGKLIVYHGATDIEDPPGPVIDYYEAVVRTMGGRARTESFFRFFLIPGMNHCGGGPGELDIDWLKTIEDWVEEGRAPDILIGKHAGGVSERTFTRPVFPYPDFAKYRGKGDVDTAESFGRARRIIPAPTP